MKRLVALAPIAVFAALVLVFGFYALHHNPQVIPRATVGSLAPNDALPSLDGAPPAPLHTALKGTTLVNFFASWCVPCVQEQPALMALRAQGVKVIGVVSPWRYDAVATQAFLGRGNPYSEVLLDPDGKATLDFGVSGVPETFVVGKDGRIAAKYALPLDAQSAEALSEQVDKARHG